MRLRRLPRQATSANKRVGWASRPSLTARLRSRLALASLDSCEDQTPRAPSANEGLKLREMDRNRRLRSGLALYPAPQQGRGTPRAPDFPCKHVQNPAS